MPYAYYAKLSRRNKQVYRRSDALERVPMSGAWTLAPLVESLQEALAEENGSAAQRFAQDLVLGITADLGVAPVEVKVLARRPSNSRSELHGLYELADPERPRSRARITVWMRTAQRKQVVAFKTFFRTLLHEVCHHLDYELFKLPESFHTEGFFKRESSLYAQLTRHAAAA